ncbi:MAG: FecR family protein [Patescibacteria group bacterium]|nr:FecR family protein [Patescibacteria group bacterium]
MRKWGLIVFLCLLMVAGLGWWFWSWGNINIKDDGIITLKIQNPGVEVMRQGSDDWSGVRENETLSSGDRVRTDGNGLATIVFFGQAEARLAPQSELVVQDIERAADGSRPTKINLRLELGRVWSRILHLAELDDSYTVSVNQVAATVRGTTFEIARTPSGSELVVWESAVEVGPSPDQVGAVMTPTVISEGFNANFDAAGKVSSIKVTADEVDASDWHRNNINLDNAFAKFAAQQQEQRLKDMGGSLPGGPLDGLNRLSENLHLKMAAEKAPRLYAAYVERRLYGIKRLIERNRSGAAFSTLTVLEQDINSRLRGPDADAFGRPLRRALFGMSDLLREVGPSSPYYRLKQKIEDMEIGLAINDDAGGIYARMRAMDARLDEATVLIGQMSLDEAKDALDAARQGIANAERDIDRLPETVESSKVSSLRGRLGVIKAREAALRIKLATAISPPVTEMSSGNTTSTPDFLTATSTPEFVQSTSTSYENIILSARPGSPIVGDKVTLSVKATRADGTSADVTANSIFTLTGAGTINGPVFETAAVGPVTLRAEFKQEDEIYKAEIRLDVKAAPVVLKSLKMTAESTGTLGPGESAVLHAQAVYSDNSTKDVTVSTSFTTSNNILGYVVNNVLYAGKDAVGQLRVIGKYREGTVEVGAYIDFQISGR